MAARAVLQIFGIVLLVLLVTSLLLGLFWLPIFLRIVVAIGAWCLMLWVAARCLRPALRRWTLSQTAQHVEQVLPHMDERLSSAVELTTGESNPAFRGSPQLVAHLVRLAEEDAAAIQPATIVPLDSIVRWIVLLVPLIAAWLVLTINPRTAQPVLRGLYGSFFPWRSHLPAALEQVHVQPGNVILAESESLEVTARIDRSTASHGTTGATLERRFAGAQILSQPLDSKSEGVFSTILPDLHQGFDYLVKTDNGSSDWFTATVHPRPAISRLDLHYDYPAYTALPPRDLPGSDGNIDALAGTRVTLLLHTADAVVLHKSSIVLDEPDRQQQVLSLLQSGPTDYKCTFPIVHSGGFRIHLLNEYGLENADNQLRSITAHFDQVPTVKILSPSAQATVRPDDVVPVEYVAEDDFGVAALAVELQVDEQSPRQISLRLPAGDRHRIAGAWNVDIARVLASLGVKNPSRLTYQFQALDNRDPDPQKGLSARQVLILDRNQGRTYLDQLNEQRKRTLEEAIRRAIARLRDAENRANRFQWFDERHFLSPEEQLDAHDLRQLLTTTGMELSSAAEEYLNTAYAEVAQSARNIAQTGIVLAADDVARAEFASADPPQRKYNAGKSKQEIVDSRQQLEKLIEQAELAQRQFEATEALAQAARTQQEAADQMERQPKQVNEARQTQQRAINKLNEAMQKNPALQDARARELAQKMAELTQKIEQDQQQQTKLQKATSKLEDVAQVQQSANALARQQKEINQSIAELSESAKDALHQAGAELPHRDEQDRIAQQLETGELQPAGAAMKNAANRLHDAARKLQAAQKKTAAPEDKNSEADAATAAESIAKKQGELAKLLEPQTKQMEAARKGALAPEQAAEQEKNLSQQTQAMRESAGQLATAAKSAANPLLARRAQDVQPDLAAAAEAQQEAAKAQSQQRPEEAANAQARAQEALSKADHTLRGNPRPPEKQTAKNEKQNGIDQSTPNPEDQEQTAASEQNAEQNAGDGPPMNQAAQAAQEAAAAQQQAMKPNSDAAQQAANALSRALAAARRAVSGNSKPSSPDSSSQASSSASGSGGQQTGFPGSSDESRAGVRGQNSGGDNKVPAAAQDLGISAGDWARLPPLLRNELLSAAQQSGPPAYRQMIRDYYVRIARMQDQTNGGSNGR